MSKTTQENKKKKALSETKVEESAVKATQKAQAPVVTDSEPSVETQPETATVTKLTKSSPRSKKYKTAKAKVDATKFYPLIEAVKLAQTMSISKFDGKIEAHVLVYDAGTVGEISFPHLETAAKKIVVANDTIIADIKAGKIDFDILVATPAVMPKLLPFARVLGPKGLMPNPKSGTLTDNPDAAVAKLSVAKTVIKTEAKAPVVHVVVGKVSQSVDEIVDNVNELVKLIHANKIKKLVLAATMGPAVKVEIEK